MWADHNRPWDFDHLHASAYFYKKKTGAFAEVCRQWGNCIGNLRAWPFEENRSDSKSLLRQKMSDEPQKLNWSLIKMADIDAFSHGDSACHQLHAAHPLCYAIMERYISIYADWYRSSCIAELVADCR